jgi:hypothetical protein
MMERIEEIRERLNKATPGKWSREIGNEYREVSMERGPLLATVRDADDGTFIAHAPNDIKYLLEQITALQEENAAYKATGLTPKQIAAGTKVEFDIGEKGFLKAINTAFKKKFGITADDVPKIMVERDELKKDTATFTKALEIAAKYSLWENEWKTHKGFEDYEYMRKNYFIQQARSAINSKEGEKNECK